jgi:hypothetical protein
MIESMPGKPPPDITLLCLDDDRVMPEGDDAEASVRACVRACVSSDA